MLRAVYTNVIRWNNLKKKVSLAKQRISPHVQEQSEIVMEVCIGYGGREG